MDPKIKKTLFIVGGVVIFILGIILGAIVAGNFDGAAIGGTTGLAGLLAGIVFRGPAAKPGTMGSSSSDVVNLQKQLDLALAGRQRIEKRSQELEIQFADLVTINSELGADYRDLVDKFNKVRESAERVDSAVDRAKATGDELAILAGIPNSDGKG